MNSLAKNISVEVGKKKTKRKPSAKSAGETGTVFIVGDPKEAELEKT